MRALKDTELLPGECSGVGIRQNVLRRSMMSFCVRYRAGDSVWSILSLKGSEQQNPKGQAQRDVTAEGQQGALWTNNSL